MLALLLHTLSCASHEEFPGLNGHPNRKVKQNRPLFGKVSAFEIFAGRSPRTRQIRIRIVGRIARFRPLRSSSPGGLPKFPQEAQTKLQISWKKGKRQLGNIQQKHIGLKATGSRRRFIFFVSR